MPKFNRTQPAADSSNGKQDVLSYSTILILACIIVGLVYTRGVEDPIGRSALLYGVFGVIAWAGLGAVAVRRERKQREDAIHSATRLVEGRMAQHISRSPPPTA